MIGVRTHPLARFAGSGCIFEPQSYSRIHPERHHYGDQGHLAKSSGPSCALAAELCCCASRLRLTCADAGRVAADEIGSCAEPSPDLPAVFNIALNSVSGLSSAPETAMRCAAQICALAAVSETVGIPPLDTYETASGDLRERAAGYPVLCPLRQGTNS